jgi:hypothetical protein
VIRTPEQTLIRLAADLDDFRAAHREEYPYDDTPLALDLLKRYEDLFHVRFAGVVRLLEPQGYGDPKTLAFWFRPHDMGAVTFGAQMLRVLGSHLK